MITAQVEIGCKHGLHTRPATLLATIAQKFCSDIEVEYRGKIVQGKSVLGLLQLEAKEGSTLSIRINGKDEEKAMEALIRLALNRFEAM
ncbi:HPr family phosphocarrier protein [Aneurinibacillus terranovensis]|uniref:HPr family phosphocarrier protein n=1 Tax=Aneurinibacillus terranovensis TaxID=278991 RepID=UPI00041A8394|nr:HPr family phosphocarrier protein [Aneurinibacillus terranovensis]